MADKRITELTEDTSPTLDDLIVTVTDPGGTPVTKKVTLANLLAALQIGYLNIPQNSQSADYTALRPPRRPYRPRRPRRHCDHVR